jgi:hypothetical protein
LGLSSTWAYFSVKSGSSVTPEPDRSGEQPAPAPTPAGPEGGAQGPAGTPESTPAGGVTPAV